MCIRDSTYPPGHAPGNVTRLSGVRLTCGGKCGQQVVTFVLARERTEQIGRGIGDAVPSDNDTRHVSVSEGTASPMPRPICSFRSRARTNVTTCCPHLPPHVRRTPLNLVTLPGACPGG